MHCPHLPPRLRLLLLATILSSSALPLASCAFSPALPGRLTVDLQAVKECQRLANAVPAPQISPQSDYRKLAPQALVQLHKANDAIAARNQCDQKVIDAYAGKPT